MTEDGEIYKKQPHNGTVVNSVGAGDSMVAGFWRDISILALMSVHWSLELQREVRRHFSPGWHPGGYCKTAGQTVQRISDLKGKRYENHGSFEERKCGAFQNTRK
mgnify:CR=1 FL=1